MCVVRRGEAPPAGETVGLDKVGAVVGLVVGPPVGVVVGATVGVDSKLVSSSGFPGLSCKLQAACGPKLDPRPRDRTKGSTRLRSKASVLLSPRNGAMVRGCDSARVRGYDSARVWGW